MGKFLYLFEITIFMKLSFKCSQCQKRFFFQEDYQGLCHNCYQKKIDEKKKREIEQQKKEKAKLRNELANQKLKEELAKKSILKIKKEPLKKEIKPELSKPQEIKEISLFNQAKSLAKTNFKVLYIEADVKRLKAIEWVDNKKRIALNKEREIRHTHKGGWSQEKFQKFVKSQKRKTDDWLINNLTKEGVLKPPYDKIIIKANDGLKTEIIKYVQKDNQ
jgi:hypothetical protein